MTQAAMLTAQPRLEWVTETEKGAWNAAIQTSTGLHRSLVDVCLSYLRPSISFNLEEAAALPQLHFTAEDLTRLCHGTYGLYHLSTHDALEEATAEGISSGTAINLTPLKRPVLYRQVAGRKGEELQDYGVAYEIRTGGVAGALQWFEEKLGAYIADRIRSDLAASICEKEQLAEDSDEYYRLYRSMLASNMMVGRPLSDLLKVVERTRFVIVRLGNLDNPAEETIGTVPQYRKLGFYRDLSVSPENICVLATPDVHLPAENAPMIDEGDGWRWLHNVLKVQYCTSLIHALRDNSCELVTRDWVKDTPEEGARDAFVEQNLQVQVVKKA